jgi:hypothetical protein
MISGGLFNLSGLPRLTRLAGNMPARAGRMPAVPGFAKRECARAKVAPHEGEREHVARSSRYVAGLLLQTRISND